MLVISINTSVSKELQIFPQVSTFLLLQLGHLHLPYIVELNVCVHGDSLTTILTTIDSNVIPCGSVVLI